MDGSIEQFLEELAQSGVQNQVAETAAAPDGSFWGGVHPLDLSLDAMQEETTTFTPLSEEDVAFLSQMMQSSAAPEMNASPCLREGVDYDALPCLSLGDQFVRYVRAHSSFPFLLAFANV